MKRKEAGAMPVNQEPAEAPKVPSTIAAWQARIAELENNLTAAELTLVEQRAARRTAAGAALVFGADDVVVVELEAIERDAERRADSLKCAIALAQAELEKLVEADRQARVEAQRQRRVAVARDIVAHAAHVDRAFAVAGEHLRAVERLIAEFRAAGGEFPRSLRGCTTRALKANSDLRDFVLADFVGERHHLLPLAEQFAGLGATPGAAPEAAPGAPEAA
jgi:hypothetical protein